MRKSATHKSLKARHTTLLHREQMDPAWTFDQFYADMAPGFRPGLYLARHNPDLPHSPENSYWSETQPRSTRGRATKNRCGQRRGSLKFLFPWPSPNWIALCDCGRLRTFTRQMTAQAVACGMCAPINGRAQTYFTELTERDWIAMRLLQYIDTTHTPRPVVAERTAPDTTAQPPRNWHGKAESMRADSLPPLTRGEMLNIRIRQGLEVTFK